MAAVITQNGATVVPANGTTMELKLFSFMQSQLAVNRFRFQYTIDSGFGDRAGDLAKSMCDSLQDTLADCMCSQANVIGAKVAFVGPDPLPLPGLATTLQPGTGSANPLPAVVSGILTFQTPLAGRSRRGRVFIPFPTVEDVAANDLPTTGYQNLIYSFGLTLLGLTSVSGPTTTYTIKWGVWSAAHAYFTQYNDVRANAKWSTQHRRGSYGKVNLPNVT